MSVFFVTGVFARDKCVFYKTKPNVQISKPDWVKKVGQPLRMMDFYHGNVVDELPNRDGYCVGVKDINAVIGYSDFLIKIDMRHKQNSCAYKTVLAHEGDHITAYLSVIDDFQDDLKKSVYSAANSIMPIYVKSENDISSAIDEINYKLQNHPDVVLVKQKISAAEELRNAKVDEDNKQYEELQKCDG